MDFQPGKFHPLVVHLPIGILLLAFLFEVLSRTKPYRKLRFAVRPALGIGTFTALIAVVTGLYLADTGAYDERLLRGHKYLGIATAALSVLIYVHRRYAIVPDKLARRRIRLAMFMALTLFIFLTGHFGGSLTHGEGYWFPSSDEPNTVAYPVVIPDPEHAVVFDDIIQPLLRQKCVACHGPSKQKGELRLDSWEAVMKGGKHGDLWKNSDAEHSLLFTRVALPVEDKEHMPPRERTQLSNVEVDVIRSWIAEGAMRPKRVNELVDKKPIASFIQSYSSSSVWDEPATDPDESAIRMLREAGVKVLPLALQSKNLVIRLAQLRDEEVTQIRRLAPNIVEIDLSGGTWNEGQLSFLPSLTRLKKLSLQRSVLANKDAEVIGGCASLEMLNVSQTNISDEGVLSWKGLTRLKRLYLFGTKVSSAGHRQLSSLPALQIDTGNYVLPFLPSDTITYRRARK
jgi:uncharacterized membrane protein